MKRAVSFALLALVAASAHAASVRRFEATYTAVVAGVPVGVTELKLWLPLPVSRGAQSVRDVRIESPYRFERMRDPLFGNEYAFASVSSPPPGDLTVKVRFNATRRETRFDHPAEKTASRAELLRALRADRLVTLSPRVRKLADEIAAGKKTPLEQARAIYDYLVATMKYDKTIPGWGNGDTERACDIRAGNCTDFHSLFISLARAKGIPARFVIGFPLTASKDGEVKGYHCWAEFYVEARGWIPVDASEASKSSDPSLRRFFFGNLDPDRVQFTIGRDLELKPRTLEPLNYFIYPRAEAGGRVVGTPSIALQFRDTAAGGVAAGGLQ